MAVTDKLTINNGAEFLARIGRASLVAQFVISRIVKFYENLAIFLDLFTALNMRECTRHVAAGVHLFPTPGALAAV